MYGVTGKGQTASYKRYGLHYPVIFTPDFRDALEAVYDSKTTMPVEQPVGHDSHNIAFARQHFELSLSAYNNSNCLERIQHERTKIRENMRDSSPMFDLASRRRANSAEPYHHAAIRFAEHRLRSEDFKQVTGYQFMNETRKAKWDALSSSDRLTDYLTILLPKHGANESVLSGQGKPSEGLECSHRGSSFSGDTCYAPPADSQAASYGTTESGRGLPAPAHDLLVSDLTSIANQSTGGASAVSACQAFESLGLSHRDQKRPTFCSVVHALRSRSNQLHGRSQQPQLRVRFMARTTTCETISYQPPQRIGNTCSIMPYQKEQCSIKRCPAETSAKTGHDILVSDENFPASSVLQTDAAESLLHNKVVSLSAGSRIGADNRFLTEFQYTKNIISPTYGNYDNQSEHLVDCARKVNCVHSLAVEDDLPKDHSAFCSEIRGIILKTSTQDLLQPASLEDKLCAFPNASASRFDRDHHICDFSDSHTTTSTTEAAVLPQRLTSRNHASRKFSITPQDLVDSGISGPAPACGLRGREPCTNGQLENLLICLYRSYTQSCVNDSEAENNTERFSQISDETSAQEVWRIYQDRSSSVAQSADSNSVIQTDTGVLSDQSMPFMDSKIQNNEYVAHKIMRPAYDMHIIGVEAQMAELNRYYQEDDLKNELAFIVDEDIHESLLRGTGQLEGFIRYLRNVRKDVLLLDYGLEFDNQGNVSRGLGKLWNLLCGRKQSHYQPLCSDTSKIQNSSEQVTSLTVSSLVKKRHLQMHSPSQLVSASRSAAEDTSCKTKCPREALGACKSTKEMVYKPIAPYKPAGTCLLPSSAQASLHESPDSTKVCTKGSSHGMIAGVDRASRKMLYGHLETDKRRHVSSSKSVVEGDTQRTNIRFPHTAAHNLTDKPCCLAECVSTSKGESVAAVVLNDNVDISRSSLPTRVTSVHKVINSTTAARRKTDSAKQHSYSGSVCPTDGELLQNTVLPEKISKVSKPYDRIATDRPSRSLKGVNSLTGPGFSPTRLSNRYFTLTNLK